MFFFSFFYVYSLYDMLLLLIIKYQCVQDILAFFPALYKKKVLYFAFHAIFCIYEHGPQLRTECLLGGGRTHLQHQERKPIQDHYVPNSASNPDHHLLLQMSQLILFLKSLGYTIRVLKFVFLIQTRCLS